MPVSGRSDLIQYPQLTGQRSFGIEHFLFSAGGNIKKTAPEPRPAFPYICSECWAYDIDKGVIIIRVIYRCGKYLCRVLDWERLEHQSL